MIKSKLYKSCSQLPMIRFIRMMIEKDYSLLIINKGFLQPSKKELEKLWNEIYEEYSNMNNSEQHAIFFQLIKSKTTIQNRIFITQCCIDGMKDNYSYELSVVLKKMGFNFKFSKESYQRDLLKVVAKSKPLVLQLQKIDKEIAPFLEGDQLSLSDFEDIFVSLSKFQGYKLSLSETTVIEFVKILNNYKKWLTPKK